MRQATDAIRDLVATWGLWIVAVISVFTVVALAWTLDKPNTERPVSAAIVVSLGLGLVGTFSFATFYYREGDRPMRLALTVTFVSMYLLLFTLLIANPAFRRQIEEPTFPKPSSSPSIGSGTVPAPAASGEAQAPTPDREPLGMTAFSGFQVLVTTIVGFYFATQAAESIADKLKGKPTAATDSAAAGEGKPAQTQDTE